MIYELYCCGHLKRFKTADGYIRRCVHFCSGCRKRPIRKFLKDHETSKVSEFYDDAVVCGSALIVVATASIYSWV